MPIFSRLDRSSIWLVCDTTWCHQAFLSVVISIMFTYGALSARLQLTSFKLCLSIRHRPRVRIFYRCLSLRERNRGISWVVLDTIFHLSIRTRESILKWVSKATAFADIFCDFLRRVNIVRLYPPIFALCRDVPEVKAWEPGLHTLEHTLDLLGIIYAMRKTVVFPRRESHFERLDIRPSWQ